MMLMMNDEEEDRPTFTWLSAVMTAISMFLAPVWTTYGQCRESCVVMRCDGVGWRWRCMHGDDDAR